MTVHGETVEGVAAPESDWLQQLSGKDAVFNGSLSLSILPLHGKFMTPNR